MPSFEVQDQDGNTVKSEDFIGKGRKTIIYFYPKDNTSGCTAEACSFRDNLERLDEAGMAVVGVSVDSDSQHRKFKEKHGLNFPLIADTDHQLVELFGVWQEKSMYGRKYMGTVRTTFIIDEQGVVKHIIEKVNTKDSANQILELGL